MSLFYKNCENSEEPNWEPLSVTTTLGKLNLTKQSRNFSTVELESVEFISKASDHFENGSKITKTIKPLIGSKISMNRPYKQVNFPQGFNTAFIGSGRIDIQIFQLITHFSRSLKKVTKNIN